MAVNLTTNPYYDDFDSTKNFYRILFKPGTPVQARELTQLQSIIQDQIKKFANHVFVDGSRVLKDDPVSVTINDKVRSVKLQQNINTGNLLPYLNKYVTGATSNIIGKVNFVFDADNPDVGDPPTIVLSLITGDKESRFDSEEVLYFYDSLSSANAKANTALTVTTDADLGLSGIGNYSEYSDTITLSSVTGTIKVGDEIVGILSPTDSLYIVEVVSPTTIIVNRNVGSTNTNANLTFVRKNTSPSLIVSTSSGAYYKNGFFIGVNYQSVVPQKYTAHPTKSVILRYNESIIDYNEDSTLLDPAFGSSNYLAPGADRLKITLTLDSVDLTSDNKPDINGLYIEVARFKNGNLDLVESGSDSIYAGLGQILADRTYAESGNYVVKPFRFESAGSTADGASAKFFVNPGRAFVGGYDVATVGKTELDITKARTTKTDTALNINSFYGNYVIIESPQFGLPNLTDIDFANYYECHSTTDRSAMGIGTVVGYVVPKHIQYETGYGANAAHRFYWYYYEQASTTLTPDNIRSIIGVENPVTTTYGNTGTYTAPTFFANVHPTLGLVGGPTGNSYLRYYDVSENRNVFPIPKNNVKTVTNNKVIYSKLYSASAVTGSSAIITTVSPAKFVGPLSSTVSNSMKRQYYTFVVSSVSSGTYSLGQHIPSEDVTVSLDNTGTQLTLNFGSGLVTGTVDVIVTIENDTLNRRTKTLVENYTANANINDDQVDYSVLKSDVFAFKGIYKLGSNTFAGNYSSGTAYVANNLVQANGLIYHATNSSTGVSVTNTSYWNKVQKESFLKYSLDNGQTDNWYDHGKVRFLGLQSEAPGNVLIVFDYFTHSGEGAIDAGSYPASLYDRIPTYKSTTDGKEFVLRDCLDYRVRRQDDTAMGGGVYGNRLSNVFYFDTSIKPNPTEVPGTEADVEYYLGRIDRVYVQNRDASATGTQNKFSVDVGIPSTNPIAPPDNTDKNRQLIATLRVPPYTASASDIAVIYNDAPRYTMKDISVIDKKVSDLEKRVKKQGLDIIALNNVVFDRNGSSGNILYKTGILVDNFSDYGAGYVNKPEFTAAIDTARQECRPAFSATQHNLFYTTDPDVTVLNDLLVMNYTEEEFISQTIASRLDLNPNPASIISNNGRAIIYPPALVATNGGGLSALVEDVTTYQSNGTNVIE